MQVSDMPRKIFIASRPKKKASPAQARHFRQQNRPDTQAASLGSGFIKFNLASRGFSVMEAVVATAVFALALSGIAGSFIAIMRLDAKSRSIRSVEQNVRFISEFLTREIRNGDLDFSPTGYNGSIGGSGQTAVLYLVNRDGEKEAVTMSGNGIRLTKAGNSTNLSGSDTIVSRLDFYIRPTTPGSQTLVTFVYIISSNNGSRPGDQTTLAVQSSVAARDY